MRSILAFVLTATVVLGGGSAWSWEARPVTLQQRIDGLTKLGPVGRARSIIAILREGPGQAGVEDEAAHGSFSILMGLLASKNPDNATLRDAARNERDPGLRQRLVLTACLAGEGSLTPEVGRILTSPQASPDYRAIAAEALGRHPHPSNVPALVRVLSTDGAWMAIPVRNPTTLRTEGWKKYFYVRAAAQRALLRYQAVGIKLDEATIRALSDAEIEAQP